MTVQGKNDLSYVGVRPSNPPNVIYALNSPISGLNGTYSANIQIGDFWINRNTNTIFVLINVTGSILNQSINATWLRLGNSFLDTLTGNNPVAVPPDANNNINIVGSGAVNVNGDAATNTLTISVTGEGIVWQTIGASQTLVVNNGYFCTGGAALALALPAISNIGDTIKVVLDGSTSWTINQGVGQQIRIAASQTTSGAGGSITSTSVGDSIEMVCSVANTRWNVVNYIGNLTVV